jgi:hypothetical protein
MPGASPIPRWIEAVNRPRTIAVCAACVLVVLIGGCARKGPVSVRFTRQVDGPELDQLPRLGGSVVLLVDPAFWTDREKVSRIPIARREKTFIIGPGAAEMADKMLSRMFDEVIDVRSLDRVEDPQRFDFVIRLVHESFDDRTLFLPLFSHQRYLVDLAAEVSRLDGTSLGKVNAQGAESFWLMNLAAANPLEGDERLLDKASVTLNAAVQESLFGLMAELASLSVFSDDGL